RHPSARPRRAHEEGRRGDRSQARRLRKTPMDHHDMIKRPSYLTERGSNLREEENQYLFEVRPKANMIQIRYPVEALFKVSVKGVNTMNVRGHMQRMGRGHAKTRNWKKAIVTLADGDSIDFFQGV